MDREDVLAFQEMVSGRVDHQLTAQQKNELRGYSYKIKGDGLTAASFYFATSRTIFPVLLWLSIHS